MNKQDIQEFRYLYNVMFNNKEFIVLTSKQLPFYLLEINKKDERFEYPVLEDLKFFYSLFNNKKKFQFQENIENQLNTSNNSKNNKFHKIIKLIPKVLVGGALSVFALAMVFTDIDMIKANSKEKDIVNQLKKDGYSVEIADYNNDIIFVNEKNIPETGENIIYCEDLDELKRYIGDYNPTYDDIISLIKNNDEISDKYKEILIDGLEKMKISMPNYDLSVLFFNVKRLKVFEVSHEELCDITGQDIHDGNYACYSSETGEVYINPNSEYYEDCAIIHEVLGHGSLDIDYTDPNTNKTISFGFKNSIMNKKEGITQDFYRPYTIGSCFSEGGASIITRMITGEQIVSNYNYIEEVLRLFAKMLNVDIVTLFNNRGQKLYEMLSCQANIGNPTEYATECDVIFTLFSCRLPISENVLSDLFEKLVVDNAEEKVQENGEAEIENATEMMQNSYYDNIELYRYIMVYKYVDLFGENYVYDSEVQKEVVAAYNPAESANVVEEELSSLTK